MTPQEIVNKNLKSMLLFATAFCLFIIGIFECFIKPEPKPEAQVPVCTVLYLDRDNTGLVVYSNAEWECKLK